MNLFRKPCLCCNCKKGSKWNDCLNIGKCPKESKIKGHNVLSSNSGNLSRKMRNSHSLRTQKFNKSCKCEMDVMKTKDYRCEYIDRFGNPIVEGPIITLNGNISGTYPKNEIFEDPGATAKDHIENNLLVSRTITPSIDLENIPYTIGTYSFKYTAKDRFNQSRSIIREVTFE